MKKMMKMMNKSVKSALAALVVGGLAFSAAAAEGDIYSIDLVDDVLYGGKVPSSSSPLTIGEKAVIRVRLANSNWYDPATPGARPWLVKPTDDYAALGAAMQSLYPLKLGVMLGGQAVYASFVASSSVSTPADTYTDLFFSYTVKPGDLAMPALLMNTAGKAASATSSADYFLLNANYWRIVNADGAEAVFHFTTRGGDMPSVPSQPQNYGVSGAGMGLYVKTVDFDSNDVVPATTSGEESVWRRFHQGLTSTSSTQPSVVVNGTPTTDVTMYLWVENADDTYALPLATDGAREITDAGKDADGNDVTYVRTVLPISVPAGADPTKTFRLKGLKIGKTKVCLSSSENLSFDDMGVLVTNWLERVIEVVEPPEPYASIEVLDRAGVNALAAITASTNYWDYVAILKLTLNGAEPTKAVTFGIDVSNKDDVCPSGADDIWRIGISESTSAGDIPWLDHTTSVTFNAGETEKFLYLYALDQTADITGKITLTPALSGEGAADYTGDPKAGSFAISPATPVVFSPKGGEVLSEAIAGESYPLDLVIGDSYRRLRQAGWTVQLKCAAFGDSKWHNYTDDVSVDPDSGEASLNVIFTIERENADLEIRVVDPKDDAAQPKSKTSASVKAKITVTAPKKASATFDRGADPYAESRTETAKVYFQISQPSDNAKALYAFLRPLNDDATNKVSSTAFTTSVPNQGVYIAPGELDSGANYAKLALDDGDCSAMYEVVICTASTYSKAKEASYVAGQCTLNVTNVIPAVRSVSMGGNSVKVSGGVMPKAVAQGITKAFTIDVNDPGLKDFEATGDDAFCVKWTFGGGDAVYMWGDPSTNSISRVFTSPGEVEVQVQCQDKDMRATKTWTEPFTFTVNVLDAPAVSIVQKEDRTSFYEDETSDSSSRFYVQLNVAPDFTNATDRLVVDLAVVPNDTSATATYTADDCVLSKTSVEFTSGMTTGPTFYLKSLDGTQDSAGKGFRITAKVRADSAKADAEGKTWIDGEYEINIQNRAPSVLMPTESKDAEGNPITTTTTINATQSVGWSVTDVDADLDGLTVKWETSEGSIMEYVQGTGTDTEKRKYVADVRSGTHTFFFTGSGAKTVVMTVTDKDGGQASRTLYYTIAASKTMEILPQGPSSGNGTSLSAKYRDKAAGLGEGRVWTANAASQIANWVFTYGCGLDNEFRVYGRGYRVGDVDPLVDANGAAIGAASGAAGYAYGDPVYDSFLYGWLQLTRAEGKATLSDEILSIAPEHPEQANSGIAVAMPTEKDDDGNYSKTILEAIFSRELYAADNMGDINLDGIPDAYVKKYGLGIFDDEGTKTGDDLAKVATYNEDEDVIPAESLNAEERPFTALLEIRGYGAGLNDAPTLAGLLGFKPDRRYTDPAADKDSTLIAVEYLAWLDYAAANGLDAAAPANWEKWSPERPTDPTTDDTDEDGFSDGFEYSYWYRAHVGYFETRTLYGITITNHVYLTGRALTPTNPEGEVISSETIAELMDPLTAWGDQSDAATRDSDNDGLPDLLEFELGTNPFDFDTDHDGLPDGYEVYVSGTDPLKYATDGSTCDAARNLDGDHMAYTTVYHLKEVDARSVCGEEHAASIDGFSTNRIPYRCTFAIAATNEGPAVVQWFTATSLDLVQTAESPVTEDITVFEVYDGLSAWENTNSWTRVAVRAASVPLVSVGTIGSFEVQRLAADVGAEKAFLAETAADGATVRRGLPKRLTRGSFVRKVESQPSYVELILAEDVSGETNHCNVAWQYGTADGGYGELAIGPTQSVAKASLVLAAPDETRTLAFLHSYVYQQFGFDPRTAWSSTSPFNNRDTGRSATPMRTRPYTAYDEYLLMFYYLNSRAIGLSDLTPTKSNPWSAIFAKYLTNPCGKDETLASSNAVASVTNSYGDDTDGDGVPDGWELYVMSGAKAEDGCFAIKGPDAPFSPTRHFAEFPASLQDPDGDKLNEAEEFAGWSTCLAYSNVTATVSMDTLGAWVNKLLPTNPYEADTDGDGLTDSEERGAFAYGDPLSAPDIANKLCVSGGGLNPCSVDTDQDGLPDGWELQFAGAYSEDVSKSVVSTATNGTDVVTTTNTTIVGEFSGGMDGTTSDATLDYDMDGLENWQEYMVGAMRCWRYDDPITPFGIIPQSWYYAMTGFSPDLEKFGFADMNEFFYRTFKDKSSPYYNPHMVMDQASCARYFSHVTNAWDVVYKEKGGAQYMFKHRLDDVLYKDLYELYLENYYTGRPNIGTPEKYVSCDPTKADTDQDGMDDYYELFHGLNPLLGAAEVAEKSGAYDVVYVAWGGTGKVTDPAKTAFNNSWVAANVIDLKNDPSGLDYVNYPWINGMAEADPDGDDIRNQDEAIMPQVGSTQGYHTDPSPLWMTDVNYTNSLTSRFYTMPYREKSSLGGNYTFEWEGQTYEIIDGFGTYETDLGDGPEPALMDYTIDQWGVDVTYMFSFEQTEGYDTDGDCYGDKDEIGGKFSRATTDPQDAHSPTRRQAMYFQGPAKPSMLLSPTYDAVALPSGNTMANEMAFTQFTVECWACPESTDDATLVERTVNVEWSNPGDEEFVRRNFSLQIKDGKLYAYYETNGTIADNRVEVFSDEAVTTNAWTHFAATCDGKALRLYVNGQEAGKTASGLRPCNGASSITLYAMSGLDPNEYHDDALKENFVFAIGASASAHAFTGRGIRSSAYSNFYKGYIDEVRVWDGARSASAIAAAMNTRYTADLANENRLAVYDEWKAGRRRYSKDADGNDYDVTPELRYHYSFDSLPAADNEAAVAKMAHGFGDTGDKAPLSRPADYTCYTWDFVVNGVGLFVSPYGSVYDSLLWVPWVPNTVAHLPFLTGMTQDSQYWTEDFKGFERGSYQFPRTAEPYIGWVQARKRMHESADGTPAIETRPDFLCGVSENYRNLFEFDSRNRNIYADALLPLGGAYAKYVPASLGFWDGQGASTISPITGRDSDNDGLPDWWELYAEENYRRADMGSGEFIGWNTIVDYNGAAITAGDAYLRDLAHGAYMDAKGNAHISSAQYAQTADVDSVGIPDWWQELYGLKGEDAFADHDNDGLCNIIEYMLSEKFDIRGADGVRKVFDPTKAKSVMSNDADYFFPIGSLYVGDIFADHDFIEDVWERQYDVDYVSTLVYDGKSDNDDDGWSAFAEARYAQQVSPIEANNKEHLDITSGLVQDYPIPTIQLKVKYNGVRADDMESTSYGVWIGRDLASAKSADAQYYIQGSKVAKASQSSSSVSGAGTEVVSSNEYKRVIGPWADRHVLGTLTPGNVNAGSIRIQIANNPSSVVYSWRLWWASTTGGYYTYHRGTRADYLAAERRHGDAVELLTMTDSFMNLQGMEVRTDYNSEKATLAFGDLEVGTVNLNSGEYDFDLGKFAGVYVQVEGSTNDTEFAAMEDQTIRIVYSVNPSTGTPRNLYLGEADTGYVREGKNQIFVWADLDGDEAFTIGEPCGFVRDIDVSWRTRATELEVFDHSPVMPRIALKATEAADSSTSLDGVDADDSSADRGQTVAGYCRMLHDKISDMDLTDDARATMEGELDWLSTNVCKAAEVQLDSLEQTRVRIVRWAVDGQPVYRVGTDAEVVFDKKMMFSNRAFLTEADILADGDFDLDWAKLKTDVVDRYGVQLKDCPVTNVAYLVVLGDGRIHWNTSLDASSCPKILNRVIERRYSLTRAATAIVNENAVVYSSHPTLKWTIVGEDDSSYEGYTAFQLQILDATGSTVVWESGTQLLPARDSKGDYVWEVPAFVGDDLAASVNYRWRVSVLNAKYSTPSWTTALTPTGCFRIEPEAFTGDYGKIRACVRYFGPKAEVLDQGTVRVEAFTSPDFTGVPAARVTLPASEKTASAASDTKKTFQIELEGLGRGTYYLRAYIDSDLYGTKKVRDDWESWGYFCDRTGASSDIFAPVAVTIDGTYNSQDVCTIYIEDTDINGNRIPDAYEMHVNGGTLDNGASSLNDTLACGLAVKTDLVTGLNEISSNYSSVIGHFTSVLSTRGLAALALGVPATSVSTGANGQVQVLNQVEGVEVTSIKMVDGQISLKVAPKTTASEVSSVSKSFYGDVVAAPITVKIEVLRATELGSNDWETISTQTVTVTGFGELTLAATDVADGATSAFYKVRITQQ